MLDNLTVRKFDIGSDLYILAGWIAKRGLSMSLLENLPQIGALAIIDEKPVAAFFIRLCESGGGILDSLISDPDAPSLHRHHALDLLFVSLIETSRELGLTQLLGFSLDSGTLERSKKHGFMHQVHTVTTLDLS